MNTTVLFFFVHNVLATLLLGGRFALKRDRTFKYFGIALLLNAVAFAVWSAAVYMKASDLDVYVTYGTLFFIVSLVFFLLSAMQNFQSKSRQMIIGLGVVLGALVLYLRAFVFPSAPGFSSEGFFFFNPHPTIQMFYIFGLILATIPAIDAVASKFKSNHYRSLFRFGFLAEVAGAIVLLTSSIANPDTIALNATGWIIGVVYLVLWTTFVFGRKAWA
jgi:hypothetical protein